MSADERCRTDELISTSSLLQETMHCIIEGDSALKTFATTENLQNNFRMETNRYVTLHHAINTFF